MLIEKLPIFLVNTHILSRFHKHSFTLYPSLSGQVEISSILQRMLIEKLPIFLVITLLLFCSHKHSFTPYLSLSPYWRTDRKTDRETNTLAARGLEELCSSCAVVPDFWLWREIVLGVTYLPYQLWFCVIFLVAAGNSFGLCGNVWLRARHWAMRMQRERAPMIG